MKKLVPLLCLICLLVTSPQAAAQDREARFNSLLAEIEADELEHKVSLSAREIAEWLVASGIPSMAILPFHNERNQRTVLTEYLTAQLCKKLMLKTVAEVVSAYDVARLLPDHLRLATLRCPQECDSVAARLQVSGLVRGRIVETSESMVLLLELYDARSRRIISTSQTPLSRTKGVAALMQMPYAEMPLAETEDGHTLKLAMRSLVNKLISQITTDRRLIIGVVEFWDWQGRVSQLGKLMTENLTDFFVAEKKYVVVEREQLQQVLHEHALIQTGIMDTAQAQALGKVVGAEVLIAGSLNELGNEIKINVRALEVKSGAVLAVAEERLAKTETMAKMLRAVLKE